MSELIFAHRILKRHGRGIANGGPSFAATSVRSIGKASIVLTERFFSAFSTIFLMPLLWAPSISFGAVVHAGGKFVTLDPCYVPGQFAIGKFLSDHDRGEYVRDRAGFGRLLSRVRNVQSRIFHDLSRIPYTQVVMEVTLGS